MNPLTHSVPLSVGAYPTGVQTPGAVFVNTAAAQLGNAMAGKDGIVRPILFAGAQPDNTGTVTNDFLQPLVAGTAIITDATASAARIRLKTMNGSGTASVQRVSLGFGNAVSAIAINSSKGTLLGAAPGTAAPCTIDALSDLEDTGELDVTVTFSTAGAKAISIETQFTQLNLSFTVT